MKNNDPRLDPHRFYEIVHVPSGNAWRARIGSDASVLGTIISPQRGKPGAVHVIQGNGHRTLNIDPMYLGRDVDLRPLSQKDQRKIEDAHANVSG